MPYLALSYFGTISIDGRQQARASALKPFSSNQMQKALHAKIVSSISKNDKCSRKVLLSNPCMEGAFELGSQGRCDRVK